MTPPQKPERPPQPVDTSSQVSTEVAEASLEDIPTSISPIAAISRTRSVTPLVDAMELQANANKAPEDLLTTKASIDTCRQRAIWELGIVLHCNESQAAKYIKEAKAICSQVTFDAQTTCSQLTLEAKTNYSWVTLEAKTACSTVVKKVKTTRGHVVQEAKATCSKAISEVETQRVSQAESYQREHGNIMQDLEEQVIQEESRSQADFLSAFRSPFTTVHQSLKVLWLLPTTSYRGKHLHHLHSPSHRGLPLWKNSPLPLLLPHQCPSSLLGPKDATLHQICGEYASGWNHSKGNSGRTPQLQEVRGPSLVQSTQAKPCQGI